jgi:hypothetical protein
MQRKKIIGKKEKKKSVLFWWLLRPMGKQGAIEKEKNEMKSGYLERSVKP